MTGGTDKSPCTKCKKSDEDSISCSVCHLWHHLCSGLTKQLFTKYTNNKNLIWECLRCWVHWYGKSGKVIGHCSCMFCDCCNIWFCKKSSALDHKKHSNTGNTEEKT